MVKMKALPPNAGSERRAHLRAYLLAWLRDQVLSRADLVSLEVLAQLRKTLSDDLTAVLSDLGLSPKGALDLATEVAGAGIAKLARTGLDRLFGRPQSDEKRRP